MGCKYFVAILHKRSKHLLTPILLKTLGWIPFNFDGCNILRLLKAFAIFTTFTTFGRILKGSPSRVTHILIRGLQIFGWWNTYHRFLIRIFWLQIETAQPADPCLHFLILQAIARNSIDRDPIRSWGNFWSIFHNRALIQSDHTFFALLVARKLTVVRTSDAWLLKCTRAMQTH